MDAGSGMNGGANGVAKWERCGLREAVIAVWVGRVASIWQVRALFDIRRYTSSEMQINIAVTMEERLFAEIALTGSCSLEGGAWRQGCALALLFPFGPIVPVPSTAQQTWSLPSTINVRAQKGANSLDGQVPTTGKEQPAASDVG